MSKLTDAWDKFRAIAYFADGGSMYAAIVEAEAEIKRLTRERDAALAKIKRMDEALAPFDFDYPMPTNNRTKIDYDSNGLRRLISPLELARMAARAARKEPS